MTITNYLTVIFAILLVPIAAMVCVAVPDLGIFNSIVAIAIACVKTMAVKLYFMHLN